MLNNKLNEKLKKKSNSYNCFKDIPLNDDNETFRQTNQTFSSINALNTNPNYHIYIPKETPPTQFTCCCRDPIFVGINLMLVFVIAIVIIVIIIIKN